MRRGEDFDTDRRLAPDPVERANEAGQIEVAVARQQSARHRFLKQVSACKGRCVIDLHGEDAFARYRRKLFQRRTAAEQVPAVDRQSAIGPPDRFDDRRCGGKVGDAAKGQEFDMHRQAMLRRQVADARECFGCLIR